MPKLKKLFDKIKLLLRHAHTQQYMLTEKLQRRAEYQKPGSLIPFGFKVYSQNDEDGILQEIFKRIGVSNKVFVEFGVGDGLENNTLYLLLQGWHGLWIEGNKSNHKKIARGLQPILKRKQLQLAHAFINRDNINKIIANHIHEPQIDLLSIDIDGNDYHIFDALHRNGVMARVVIIEYNAKLRPPLLFCVDYDAQLYWRGDDYFGASLKFLEIEMHKKGYSLIACSLSGVNAFFIKNDELRDQSGQFLTPYTAEEHYQPQRYSLSFHDAYAPSYQSVTRLWQALSNK